MKKLILSAVMLVGLAFAGQAQEIRKNALGIRFGDNDGFGGEISYQRGLGSNNRLELDLGWTDSDHYSAYQLAGLYQWIWQIDGGFNWYAGVGGGIGGYDVDTYPGYNGDDSGNFIFAAGDIGIEYVFDIPLQLSLDFRPQFYFGDHDYRDNSFGPNVGLGARFTF